MDANTVYVGQNTTSEILDEISDLTKKAGMELSHDAPPPEAKRMSSDELIAELRQKVAYAHNRKTRRAAEQELRQRQKLLKKAKAWARKATEG